MAVCLMSIHHCKFNLPKMNKNRGLKNLRSIFTSSAGYKFSGLKNRANIYNEQQQTKCMKTSNLRGESLFGCSFKRCLGTQRPYIDPNISYMFGKSNQHLIYKNIGQLLDESVIRWPDKLLYISSTEGIERTYAQLDRDVNRTIKAMITLLNITKGDSVGIFAYNCYNWLVVQTACNKLGAVLTPINPSYKVDELSFILKKGQVKALFLPGPKSGQAELNNHLDVLYDQRIREDLANLKLESVVLMDDYDYEIENDNRIGFKQYNNVNNLNQANTRFKINHKLNKVQIINWNYFFDNDGQLTDGNQSDVDESHNSKQSNSSNSNICLFNGANVSPDDLFGVYYTSGTTGRPKGACVSQFTAINNTLSCHQRLYGTNATRIVNCLPLPMFHIFAGVLVALTTIVNPNGCTIVFTGHKYNIKTIAEDIERYNCTQFTGTPTMLIDLLSYVEQTGMQLPLKLCQIGGAPLLSEVFKKAYKIFPHLEDVRLGYGSTENGGVSTLQSVYEPMEIKPHSAGQPVNFSEVLIVDTKTGQPVKHGQDGEILTRGPNTMVEYLDDPVKTREVITSSGWYKTGDIGRLLPQGSLQIVSRIKELIIKGGENIYPKEVEQLLLQHESLEDAHCFGVPSKRFGEEVCAWVKLKPGYVEGTKGNEKKTENGQHVVTKEEIIKFCKDNITYFKVPKYVLFVDKFPMTPTKKAQHHIMRDETIQILGLQNELS